MTRPRQPFRQGDRVRLWDSHPTAHGAIGTIAGVDGHAEGARRYWIQWPNGDVMPCREDQLQLIRRAPPPPREGDWVNLIDPRRAAEGRPKWKDLEKSGPPETGAERSFDNA